MSVRVHDNLFVGDMADYYVCNGLDIVSCTNPSVPSKGRHLQIDMVDALHPKYFHIEQFIAVRDWIDPLHPTLIHCSKGRSRGPSMALYFLAFHKHIKSASYYQAYADFKTLYPQFSPTSGVREFMADWWSALMKD